ncbi:N-acetyltransferase [Streptomyces sp. NPDC127108]|uniref:N-acetyltransferase n=1 Tax=Streptomyces sp. NPDC127108 TaxID=3345361 RepID=UPI00362E4A12
MSASFVPDDFVVPLELVTPEFRLEPLGGRHNTEDLAAWTGSIEHIRATPGFQGRSWPPVAGMTAEENLRDLVEHAEDFVRRGGFTYTVIETASGEVIGCLYIYPPHVDASRTDDSGADDFAADGSGADDFTADDSRADDFAADVRSWVRADRAALDAPLYAAVSAWLAADWPFGRVNYAPR